MKSHLYVEFLRNPATILLGSSALILAIALIGCGGGANSEEGSATGRDVTATLFASKEGEPIAKIGDETLLTVDEMQERIAQQSPFMRPRMETAEGRRGMVDQLVQFELLAREAARQNIHLEPEVQQALKRAMVSQLVSKRMRDADESAEVAEELLVAFYQENISEFVQPERVRVSHIFFSAPQGGAQARDGARAKAGQRLTEIRGSATDDAGSFSRLAREHSDDAASKAVGGDLRYQTMEDLTEAWGSQVAEAAFGLERVGSISEVVEGEKGYHILRLIGRQRAVDRKLEDVRPQILNRVRREERNRRFEAFVAELGVREGLVVDEELLERMANAGESAAQDPGQAAAANPAPAAESVED